MGSYLPENTYVVCLNQLGKEYKQLKVSDLREFKTVKLGSQERPFLIVLDKKLSDNFTCKSGWSSGAGTAAVGAGVALGLAATVGVGAASAAAATGVAGMAAIAAGAAMVPVAGWIVGGILAIGCIGYGIWLMMQSPTCNDMIGYEESKWISHHQTVKFDSKNVQLKDKHLALVKNSKLVCKEPGGVLLPFISEILAKEAAGSIGSNNRAEMGVNIGAGLLGGFLLGLGLGPGAAFLSGSVATASTAISSGIQFVGWTIAGHYIINPYIMNPLTSGTSEAIASFQGTNDSYQDIKDAQNSSNPWTTLPNATDNEDMQIATIISIREFMINNGANRQHIAQINQALAIAQQNGNFSSQNNPALRTVLNNIRNGVYGDAVRQMFTNTADNMRGMTRTPSRYENASDNINQNVNNNNRLIARNATIGLVQLALPFVSAYFGNEAIRKAAEIYEQDASNSVSVNALDF